MPQIHKKQQLMTESLIDIHMLFQSIMSVKKQDSSPAGNNNHIIGNL